MKQYIEMLSTRNIYDALQIKCYKELRIFVTLGIQ